IAGLVGAPISRCVPVRITGELFALTVDGDIVEPEPARAVELLHRIENPEVIELGAIEFVTGAQLTGSHVIAQRCRDQPASASRRGIVLDRPFTDLPDRQFPGVHTITDLVVLTDDSRAGPPLTRAVLEMTMKDIAALIDAQSDGVGSAPFVERIGIE